MSLDINPLRHAEEERSFQRLKTRRVVGRVTMAATGAGISTAASSRSRGVGLFAGLVATLLVVASVPLMLSPPVGLALTGPAIVAAEKDVELTGRFTLAGFALRGAMVEVRLDGELLARAITDADGRFLVRFAPRLGAHTLDATAAPGRYAEASTQTFFFRAVAPPAAPAGVEARAAGDGHEVTWSAPTADEDRLVQVYRVYAREQGSPWAEVASLPGTATSARLSVPAGSSVAVAAANVAGESAWGGPVTLR